ncbi:hypothetical protein E5288_WYG000474 [Bos mutus]|uniref:Uncharacterized protein n=1 Tax=Bos mutus TaxID=72004 RepID=A0A6B0QQ29_9CETA|nr:hypothetical protein [Bos mutus]
MLLMMAVSPRCWRSGSAMAEALVKYMPSVKGRAQLGVQAFADALLIIPKVLAQNSGFDLQETLVKIQAEHSESTQLVGVDLNTDEPMVAAEAGIWDKYCVKKQLLHSCTVIATNILLVDEIMRAGMSSLKVSTYSRSCLPSKEDILLYPQDQMARGLARCKSILFCVNVRAGRQFCCTSPKSPGPISSGAPLPLDVILICQRQIALDAINIYEYRTFLHFKIFFKISFGREAILKKVLSSSGAFDFIHRHITTDTWTAAKPCHLQLPPLSLGPGHSFSLEGTSPDGPISAIPAGPSSTSLSRKNSSSSVFGKYPSDTSCKYLVGIPMSYACT